MSTWRRWAAEPWHGSRRLPRPWHGLGATPCKTWCGEQRCAPSGRRRGARSTPATGPDAYAAALGRALLPDDSTLAKITRYESHLHRTMLATLRELEALQKLRTGQDAPLARLDVTGAA